ncbi:MAG: CYTH and CHAD domain-containing protein [Candidatus Dormibacteria bacterium]
MRRLWFDTFDWRLHNAGLTLERLTSGSTGGAQLILSNLAGTVLQTVSEGVPSGAGDAPRIGFPMDAVIPAGGVRTRLEPIVAMRALLPLVETMTRVVSFRVLNPEAKTVARIVLETPSGKSAHLRAPSCRLQVVGLRGYDAEAARLAHRLTALPGLRPAATSPLAAALAAVGRHPDDYSGKVDAHLTPTMSAASAIRVLLQRLLTTADANLPGVVADLDTEFLHDLRVAVRRARSALKLVGDALPARDVAGLAVELKWMGDLTTPTRDLDVYLLNLDKIAGTDAGSEDLEPFCDLLQRRRQLAQRALVAGLRSRRWSRARQRWEALAEASPPAADAPAAGAIPILVVALDRIARAYRRAVKLGALITPASPATELHALRKRCKELRYLLEFFSSLLDPPAYRAVLDQLKALQDCLGEFQDSQVERTAISAFAEAILAEGGASAATFMAMGRAADRLEARQGGARKLFAARFARFADKQTRAHMAELGPGSVSGTTPGGER